MREQPVIRGHFLRMVSYLPHFKEPAMKGHLSCSDTFSGKLRCPLKTGFTVYANESEARKCMLSHLVVAQG